MPRSPLEYLRHILDETEYLLSKREGLSKEQFQRDATLMRAFVKSIEVIGEAARLVSEETRKRAPKIPWPLITGMRHVLAHDYGAVDLDRVYDVVAHQLPDLLVHLHELIMALEKDTGWKDEP